jgi:fatty acid desaturase
MAGAIVVNEKTQSINWYRTPLEPAVLKALYRRSDAKGFAQTLGYLGTLMATGSLCYYSATHWPWWYTAILLFLHGTCYAFQINAVHELGHGTVFRTKQLNLIFVHVFAFLGWINHRMFDASHVRHHHSTLHPPDDLEVVVPIKKTLVDFLKSGFINIHGPRWALAFHSRVAKGRFEGEWENKLFPESNPERRRSASSWSQILLVGHATIIVLSIVFKLWLLPILITLAPFYGSCLFLLCNETQHIGLQDNVSDFRLCCRTFIPNPLVRFLYWHMNFHTEHHMYVGVPCYNLHRLHQSIRHDLPPCPRGILETWREIASILRKQAEDPEYTYDVPLPTTNRASEVTGVGE